MLLFNVFIQNTYVSLHLFTNSILLYIIIYNAVFLVPVVLFSLVPVAASLVPVVEVPLWWLVSSWLEVSPWFQWWRCLHGGWCPRVRW